jgi:hypothetical protein
MITDTAIKTEGMRVLAENLGLVEAERFIALMLREPFDYTEWQRGLYKDVPLKDFLNNAMVFRREMQEGENSGMDMGTT